MQSDVYSGDACRRRARGRASDARRGRRRRLRTSHALELRPRNSTSLTRTALGMSSADPNLARIELAPICVGGLFEAHLTVGDLTRSIAFYRDVVGLRVAYELPERGAAFLWIGAPGDAMLGLWSLGSAPVGLALHIAFKASLDDVLGACDRLRSSGVTPLSFFVRETDEPSVIGWMPAASVYFRDPDGHLLEYLAMLDAEPDVDAGILSWSEWVARRGAPAPAQRRRA